MTQLFCTAPYPNDRGVPGQVGYLRSWCVNVSRGAHMHEDYPKRDDANWMKHTLAWFDGWGGNGGSVRIDYRPVHDFTLTEEIDYIKPKARVY